MNDRVTDRYDGTMEPTADGGVIRFERHLSYPIREVWDAITNPARLGGLVAAVRRRHHRRPPRGRRDGDVRHW